jgi:NADH-quinone oxidoreductase subunit M
MMDWPAYAWLVLAVLAPLITGVALVVADRFADPPTEVLVRPLAVLAAALCATGAVGAFVERPEIDFPWIPALGVRIDLGLDGISAPLVLLTAGIGLLVVLLPYHAPEQDPPEREITAPLPLDELPAKKDLSTYYGCLLVVLAGAMLAFLTRDAIVFFIAFELVLVPMWVLVSRHGDATRLADRDGAALRFVLFTATGSTLMLVGILALSTRTGTTDMARWAENAGAGMDGGTQLAIAALLLVGLGIKVPVWPLHTWLPWVHATAPTAGSVLLAAVLLKMGVYGLVRLVVAPLPEGFATAAPLVGGLAVTGIVWAALACLVEPDLKRLIAWSSIAHLGFVVLALATGSQTGLQAALYGNVAHGVISALLFVVVGELKHQWGGAGLGNARAALREVTPRLGFALVVGMAASMGLPGLAGFWGEFGAVYAAWSPAPDRTLGWFRGFAVVAALGGVLAAAYAVRVLREVWAGDRTTPAIGDSRGLQAGLLGVLVTVVIVLGVYPVALLELTAPAVVDLLGWAGGGR